MLNYTCLSHPSRGVSVGAFELIEHDGTRVISGSNAAACWIYGVFETGEGFYFSCDRRSATLNALVYDVNNRLLPMDRDWSMDYLALEITPGVAKWPSEHEVANHFFRLKQVFLQSSLAGIATPLTDEQFERLQAAELRDMLS